MQCAYGVLHGCGWEPRGPLTGHRYFCIGMHVDVFSFSTSLVCLRRWWKCINGDWKGVESESGYLG